MWQNAVRSGQPGTASLPVRDIMRILAWDTDSRGEYEDVDR